MSRNIFSYIRLLCKRTASLRPIIHSLQVFLLRGTLNPFVLQPVLIPAVAPTQVQYPALGPLEPYEVLMDQILKLVQVSLDGIPSLGCVNCILLCH